VSDVNCGTCRLWLKSGIDWNGNRIGVCNWKATVAQELPLSLRIERTYVPAHLGKCPCHAPKEPADER